MSFVFARQAALLAVAMFIGGLVARPASAQVLEIGADGAVTRFDGPVVFTDDGAKTLILDAPAADAAIGADAVRQQISTAASVYALDPKLVEAVAWRESRFRPDARSNKGAIGVMQLMPGTARDLGVDPHDPVQNIRGGALYLRRMMSAFGGDVRLALAAYNAGPAAVRKHGGVPPYAETQAYVTSILGRMAASGAPLAVPVLGASQ
ncbi:lytic transglycosylase domain-containing protein [Caulobacter sp. 602-1]|uniref:lytic transglycosylase domain-containing protein n=1 Tax=Caulobacter sp. 602-1 TaxID=2492472 RepID=UPI0018F5B529|nr:lytic transglycosylase domain-containing protein [Caulobacter sp. 602-1]